MQLGEGKAQRNLTMAKLPNLEVGQGVEKMESDSSQSHPVTGQEELSPN